jgi:hypothetical protein
MGAGHPWKGEDRRVGVGPWNGAFHRRSAGADAMMAGAAMEGPWNGATESEAGRDFWGGGTVPVWTPTLDPYRVVEISPCWHTRIRRPRVPGGS